MYCLLLIIILKWSLFLCSTWKFMVFVHAKIGELKVKDLSQKLQGISGFIFHLQLCEGQQLKHQILLKSHTEWVPSLCQKLQWELDKLSCLTAPVGFVFAKEREAAMDHCHVSVWPARRHRASQWKWWSVEIYQCRKNQGNPIHLLIHLLTSCLFLLDISQVQCIKSYQAQEHDELTLEKADILHAKTITSDGKNQAESGFFYHSNLNLNEQNLDALNNQLFIWCLRAAVFQQAGWKASGCQTGSGAGSPNATWRKSQVAARASATSEKISASNVSHRNWRESTNSFWLATCVKVAFWSLWMIVFFFRWTWDLCKVCSC